MPETPWPSLKVANSCFFDMPQNSSSSPTPVFFLWCLETFQPRCASIAATSTVEDGKKRQVSSWVWWSPRPCPWEASPPHPRGSNWRSVTRFLMQKKKRGDIRFSRGRKKTSKWTWTFFVPKTKENWWFFTNQGKLDGMECIYESFFCSWLRVLNGVLTTMKRPYFLGGLAWGASTLRFLWSLVFWRLWNSFPKLGTLRQLDVNLNSDVDFFSLSLSLYNYRYIHGTPMTSIFEGQPPKTRPFPIKNKGHQRVSR